MKNKPGSEKIEKRPPKCMKELLLFPLPKLKALPEPIMQPISEQEKTRIISNFNEFRDFRNSTRKLEESVAKLLDTLSSLDKADAKEIAAGIMFDLAIGDFSSAILRKTNEVIAAKGLHCIPEDVISSPDCCHAVISFYVSNPPDRFDDILIRSFICCRATNRKTQDKLRYETLFIHGSCFPRGSKKLMDAIIDSTTLGYSEREKWLSDLSSPNPYFMIYVFRRLGDCAISNAVMNRVVRMFDTDDSGFMKMIIMRHHASLPAFRKSDSWRVQLVVNYGQLSKSNTAPKDISSVYKEIFGAMIDAAIISGLVHENPIVRSLSIHTLKKFRESGFTSFVSRFKNRNQKQMELAVQAANLIINGQNEELNEILNSPDTPAQVHACIKDFLARFKPSNADSKQKLAALLCRTEKGAKDAMPVFEADNPNIWPEKIADLAISQDVPEALIETLYDMKEPGVRALIRIATEGSEKSQLAAIKTLVRFKGNEEVKAALRALTHFGDDSEAAERLKQLTEQHSADQ